MSKQPIFKINEAVRLLQDIPGVSLTKGAIGVIVAEFVEPEVAYEVEFCGSKGETLAQIALRSEQLSKIN